MRRCPSSERSLVEVPEKQAVYDRPFAGYYYYCMLVDYDRYIVLVSISTLTHSIYYNKNVTTHYT